MWRVGVILVVACHPTMEPPHHDDAAVDSAADARQLDAGDQCRGEADCPGRVCTQCCSPGGACTYTYCAETTCGGAVVCDPNVATCTTASGSAGTCMQLTVGFGTKVWRCE